MSCMPEPTFRLLDARVGWDRKSSKGLMGFRSSKGLELAPRFLGAASPADVLPHFFPPRLSHGASRCEWLLAPVDRPHRLLRLAACVPEPSTACAGRARGCFEPWGPELRRVRSVASDCHLALVADAGAEAALLVDFAGNVRATFPVARPGAVAIAPWGELLVASDGRVLRFGLSGDGRGSVGEKLGRVVGLRAGHRRSWRDGEDPAEIWVAHRRGGRLVLSCFGRSGAPIPRAGPARLARTFDPVGVRAWDAHGFCWTDPRGPLAPCLDWNGCPTQEEIRPFGLRRRAPKGELVIEPLDGTDPRTVWHRVRVDADVPIGTEVRVSVATLDAPGGTVHRWQPGPQGGLDLLVRQPPGRYLALRLELAGDGRLTPRVRQVRVDFPRATSADLLPAVYREEPRAADFTERFAALFDAALEGLDRAIERFPVALDVRATEDAYLPWLGGLLGIAFDESWSSQQRRTLLAEAPALFAKRGTPASLSRVLAIFTGERPAILEQRVPFGALGPAGARSTCRAAVGETRLFGRNAVRFRTDRSALGQAALRSYGNPDADPLREDAYRFDVMFPPTAAPSAERRSQLDALVRALEPAHAIATVRFGGGGFVLGPRSAVGIDTALVGPPPPVLGRSTRLSRSTLLWPSPRARGPGLSLQHPVVGVCTSL